MSSVPSLAKPVLNKLRKSTAKKPPLTPAEKAAIRAAEDAHDIEVSDLSMAGPDGASWEELKAKRQ